MNPQKLYKLGYSLILLQPKRKQPMDGKWSQGPRVALTDIMDGLDDGCNLGFRPGITSKTPDGKHVHVIDLDIRNESLKEEAIAKLEEIFGRKFLKKCGIVKSGSGGSSRHFHFLMDRPMRAKTIAHSQSKFKDETNGKIRWEWEIEVFGEGKQIVLPPSIHPDTGREYEWRQLPHDMPTLDTDRLDEILDELNRASSDFDDEDLKPLGIDFEEAEAIMSKLDHEAWFVEREGWRNVGMALHHEFNGSMAAYKLWSKYSKKAPNFDPNEQRYQWSTFGRNNSVRPFRMASLIKEAQEAEIRAAFNPDNDDETEVEEVEAKEAKRKEKSRDRLKTRKPTSPTRIRLDSGIVKSYSIKQPRHLMTVPGKLGEVVEIFQKSAIRPQPQFAVHAALGLGSVLAGRNYVSDMNNYASIYLLALGRTSSGKEHVLKTINNILELCELDMLIGPPRFTSDAGIMSALEIRPKMVSLADEFSRYLSASRNSGDANQSNAQSALMELWGRIDGTYRNKGYSGRGLSKAQLLEQANSHVKRPALTLVGVATPEDFYRAIGSEDVANGFLNRFLICETEVPRLPSQEHIERMTISNGFRKWARSTAYPVTSEDEDIMDSMNQNDPVAPPDPIIIPFTKKAKRVLREIEEYCNDKMDKLDERGMDGLYGRVREIIMRLSLIVALSCEEDEILAEHVEWAKDYVFYHTAKLESRAQDTMGMSEMQTIVNECFNRIEAASQNGKLLGLTMRELTASVWKFRNQDTRTREEIVKLLMQDKDVVIRNIKRPNRMNAKTVKILTTNLDE